MFSSARSGDGSNRCGAARTHGERTAGSDIRTNGRTNSPSDDPAMASQRHRGKLTVACVRSPPRSPPPNHPRDVAGNPDASRCFVGRDSDRPAPHGSPDRGGWPGSAARPRAGRRAAPSVHSLVRSKSGRGHSGCRQEPELGSARTETAGQSSPPATAHMDAIGNDWNTAPDACSARGTASVRDLAVEVGAVPASPIRQVLTSRQASCAGRNSPRAPKPVDLWTTRRGVAHKPTGPTTAADNLKSVASGQRPTASFIKGS